MLHCKVVSTLGWKIWWPLNNLPYIQTPAVLSGASPRTEGYSPWGRRVRRDWATARSTHAAPGPRTDLRRGGASLGTGLFLVVILGLIISSPLPGQWSAWRSLVWGECSGLSLDCRDAIRPQLPARGGIFFSHCWVEFEHISLGLIGIGCLCHRLREANCGCWGRRKDAGKGWSGSLGRTRAHCYI